LELARTEIAPDVLIDPSGAAVAGIWDEVDDGELSELAGDGVAGVSGMGETLGDGVSLLEGGLSS